MADQLNLDEVLECAICLNVLNSDNKVLPCQHTFCKTCLLEVKEATRDEFRCPECRQQFDQDIEKLPSNIILNRVLNNIISKEYRKKSHKSPRKVPQYTREECINLGSSSSNVTKIEKPVKRRLLDSEHSTDYESSDNTDLEIPVKKIRRRIKALEESSDSSNSDDLPPVTSTARKGRKKVNISDESSIELTEDVNSGSETELASIESENGDGNSTPDRPIPQALTRSSSRIKDKQNKHFHMPSRSDVLNAIITSPNDKSYDNLRERKVVNDFTKVTSRYNYDPNYTSGDESLDGFIEDDNEESNYDDQLTRSEDSASVKEIKTKNRQSALKRNKKSKRPVKVKNLTTKSRNISESSDEELQRSEYTEDTDTEQNTRPHGLRANTKVKDKVNKPPYYDESTDVSESDDTEKNYVSSEESDISDVSDGDDSDVGELSKSILDKVSERSKTMSDRKKAKATLFDELKQKRALKLTRPQHQ